MNEDKGLPKGWCWVGVNELLDLVTSGSRGWAQYYSETGAKFIRIGNLDHGTITLDVRSVQLVKPPSGAEGERTRLQPNDILISITAELGMVALVPDNLGEAYINQHVALARPTDKRIAKYLAWFLASEEHGKKQLKSFRRGATKVGLGLDDIQAVQVALPPLAEQHRIVATIEQQITRLDAGVAALKSAQTRLKRYRAAVLKAAVEGKLTEAWRAEHPDTKPASVLLQRILTERRARWEADLRAKGKDPAKMRYEEPARPDMTDLPSLPEGWCWSSLGQCFAVYVGATPSRKEPSYWNGDICWVSSGEVQFCRIKETREHITQTGLDNSSTQINPAGSVLLGMIGEGRTRGQVAILDIAACNNQNCAAIWVSQTLLPPEFIYHWLWSQYDVTRTRGSGNNQPALNKSRVEEIAFPLPPLTEQEQIVAEVEQRLSVVSELEATVEANLKRAERLRQSILREAFAGRLVPQDQNDEPASVLLERIRRERAGKGRTTMKAKEREAVLIEARKVEPVEARPVSLWDEKE